MIQVYKIALIVAVAIAVYLGGWASSSHYRKPCPICPPTSTTSNSVVIDKIKGSTGTLDVTQLMKPASGPVIIQRDTIYLLPDSIMKFLPRRWQRKLPQRMNQK